MEWLYYGNGGAETFDLYVEETLAHSYYIRDAQITAEVLKDTYCAWAIIVIPSEPANETPDPAES
jgi:hypothetical protein